MTKMSGNNVASGETAAWLQIVISKHDKHLILNARVRSKRRSAFELTF